MALSIKDPEADRLARELAEATGESRRKRYEGASRRLRVLKGDSRTDAEYLADIRKIVADYNRRPVADNRSPDEIIGYDENGLPS